MNYTETLAWLYNQLPMYQRVGKAAYKADLNNTIALCKLLGNPEKKLKSIHIAGTNGKGSTAHMLASVLQTAGYKTGLYTSPHLKDFRERIKINGQEITEDYVVTFIDKYKEKFSTMGLSFFEMTVGLAFDYFVAEEVDIAVVEVGMGGRLDSTNVLQPEVSVITNIGLDHTQFLGDTLAKIAGEKAGIIKANTPVVIGETQSETKPVFTAKAQELNAPIYFADEMQLPTYNTDLRGNYQVHNIKTVLQTIALLKNYPVDTNSIISGLANTVKNTNLMGRWQTLGTEPLIICDVAHNIAGLTETMQQVANTNYNKLHIVYGMVNDKDPNTALNLLPKDATYYFCKPDIPRGMEAEELKEIAAQTELNGNAYPTVTKALEAAKKAASADDMIYVGGSVFVVAEVV